MFIALSTIIKLDPRLKISEPVETPSGTYIDGVFIRPQKRVDKYRVDFLVSYDNPLWGGKTLSNKVLVECDSQEFHDRNEKERRYEKARDRVIQKKGYRIFRYTGREIIDQPFVVATEILDEVIPGSISCDKFLNDALRKMNIELPKK